MASSKIRSERALTTAADNFRKFSLSVENAFQGSDWNLLVFETIDSTNRFGLDLCRRYRCDDLIVPRTAVVAFQQDAGRGRQGRSWSSPAGAGVYLSMIGPLPTGRLRELPLSIPLAVSRAIEELAIEAGKELLDPRIKWPNDVLIRGLKVSGILIDAMSLAGQSTGTAVVVGVGVNVTRTPDTGALGTATSLVEQGLSCSVPGVLARLRVHIGKAFEGCPGGSMVALAQRYSRKSSHREGDLLSVRYGKESFEGEFVKIGAEGELVVDDGDRLRYVRSGDVIQT